jgi:peroxiredoxin
MDLPFEVVDLGPADHVAEGETAPDFERPLVGPEFWEDRRLADLVGEAPLVLIFHPMDGAFPATYLWNEIRDRRWTDEATVVGCSISTPYEHGTLLEERAIPDVRLFSDPANGVAETYGIAHDLDGMAGIEEPRPAVFVLDEDRTVDYAWVATEWPDLPDYEAVESAIDAAAPRAD